MGAMASKITSLTIVYSTVYSDTDQRKHQSSASPETGEFPAQMASNVEDVSIWRHHGLFFTNVKRYLALQTIFKNISVLQYTSIYVQVRKI